MGDSEKLRLMRFVYLRVGHHEKRANHRAIVSGDRAKRATHRAKRLKHQAMRARDRTKRAGDRAKRAIFHAFRSKHREKNSTSRAFFSAGAAWSLIRECAQLGRIRVQCFLSASRKTLPDLINQVIKTRTFPCALRGMIDFKGGNVGFGTSE